MSDNNFQEQAKKLRDKQLESFYDLVENNQMNSHFMRNTQSEIEEAIEAEDGERANLYAEQLESYISLYSKNVAELTILMEQLGFNNINFTLN